METLTTLKALQDLQAKAVAKGAVDSFFLDTFADEKGAVIISVSAYLTDDFENDKLSVCKRFYRDTPKDEIERTIAKIKEVCGL